MFKILWNASPAEGYTATQNAGTAAEAEAARLLRLCDASLQMDAPLCSAHEPLCALCMPIDNLAS